MVERFVTFERDLFAILSNGEVWSAHPPQFTWQRIFNELTTVNAITSLEDS